MSRLWDEPPAEECRVTDLVFMIAEVLGMPDGGPSLSRLVSQCERIGVGPADLTLDVARAVVASIPRSMSGVAWASALPPWLPLARIHALARARQSRNLEYVKPSSLADFVRWRERQGLEPFIDIEHTIREL